MMDLLDDKKDITVAQRQVLILSILSDNPMGFTINEILERVNRWGAGAQKRTIDRDIDELSQNYAILEEERGNKTYYKASKFNMKNVDLTVSDMLALSFMKRVMKTYQNSLVGKDAVNILEKIEQGTGQLNQELIANLSDTLLLEDEAVVDGVIVPEYEKLIRNAIDCKNIVEIEYMDWKTQKTTTRRIHPLRLKMIEKRISVEAFCELRNEIRTFRLSRMKKVSVMEEKFNMDEKHINETNSSFIHMSGNQVCDIQLQFIGDTAKYIKEYECDKADKIIDIDDGIIFEKKAAITDEVIRFVLSFGKNAKVLEPKELKERVRQEIVQMYKCN